MSFGFGDAFALDEVGGDVDAAFVGFLWSHLSRADLGRHLASLAGRLPAGSPVVAIDNRYVEGSSTPVSRRDAEGNTWQARPLADGTVHEVMKNFWSRDELLEMVAPVAAPGSCRVEELEHFWMCRFDVRPTRAGGT